MRYEPLPAMPIRTKLYDALEALRLVEQLVEVAETEYVADVGSIDLNAILETGPIVRTAVRTLQEMVGGSYPGIPRHLLESIRNHVPARNHFPRIESIILGLQVASTSLQDAVDASAELDGNETDEVYDAMASANWAVWARLSLLEGLCIWFHQDEILGNYRRPGSKMLCML